MIEKIVEALKAFVRFNGCRDVVFSKTNEEGYLRGIREGLR
jgi:hypothetical protein